IVAIYRRVVPPQREADHLGVEDRQGCDIKVFVVGPCPVGFVVAIGLRTFVWPIARSLELELLADEPLRRSARSGSRPRSAAVLQALQQRVEVGLDIQSPLHVVLSDFSRSLRRTTLRVQIVRIFLLARPKADMPYEGRRAEMRRRPGVPGRGY